MARNILIRRGALVLSPQVIIVVVVVVVVAAVVFLVVLIILLFVVAWANDCSLFPTAYYFYFLL